MSVPFDNKSASPKKPNQDHELLLYLLPVSIYEAIVWLSTAIGTYFLWQLAVYPATLNWFFDGDKLREASLTQSAILMRGIALPVAGIGSMVVGLIVLMVIHGLFRSRWLRRNRDNLNVASRDTYAPSIFLWHRTK